MLDGEIVIANADGHSDFGALQGRLGAGARDAGAFAQESPAVLLAFDVLRHQGQDLTGLALRDRRGRLETLLEVNPGCLQLISQTPDIEEAEEWLRLLPSIEGVVAKRSDGRYLPGQREWIKVKRQRTADCVVMGVAGDRTRPWLVLGLRHADLRLHHFGLARRSHDMLTPNFVSLLAEAGPEETPIRSRWQHAAVPPWRRLPPTAVCEVVHTLLDRDRWLRHAARFVRWRPDRMPDDCWLDQLAHA